MLQQQSHSDTHADNLSLLPTKLPSFLDQ